MPAWNSSSSAIANPSGSPVGVVSSSSAGSKAGKPVRVLALTKYGSLAASDRQRFLQFAPAFAEAGIELEISPFLGDDYLAPVLAGGRATRTSIAKAYGRRLGAIANARSADAIWLHCEFLPYWPGWAELLA